MKVSIGIINFLLVNAIFLGLSYMALYSIAQYNPAAVKAGIEATVNGPGSNFTNKPFSYDFGNTTRAR